MSPKHRKIWNAIEASDIPNEDKVAFFNVWLSRIPLGGRLSMKIIDQLEAIGEYPDTWSGAGEKENPKVAEILYNSVSKETIDKYRNITIPTSAEKAELKKRFKAEVLPVAEEILSYIGSIGYRLITIHQDYRITLTDFKKGIYTNNYRFTADEPIDVPIEEISNHIKEIISKAGFEFKPNYMPDIVNFNEKYNTLLLSVYIQRQY